MDLAARGRERGIAAAHRYCAPVCRLAPRASGPPLLSRPRRVAPTPPVSRPGPHRWRASPPARAPAAPTEDPPPRRPHHAPLVSPPPSVAIAASGPTATSRTSGSCGRQSTSTLSIRSTASMSAPTDPFGNRIAVGPSSTPSASPSCSRSEEASRGAATRMPGTMPRSDKSHTPLWLAPSGPVMPARSRTNVTGNFSSATSMSTWSKARLRNVE